MIRFFILCFGVLPILSGSASRADTLQINTTSDGYKYLGAPTGLDTGNYYMDVGLFGTPGGHYSVGFAEFNTDLSSLKDASKVFLAINLRNFIEPIFGDGPTNQYTKLEPRTTGAVFTLKATALTSAFPSSGVNTNWVYTNVIIPPAAGTLVFQNSGIHYMEITATVHNWISNNVTSKVLAFIGTSSAPNTWSLNLGTLENQRDVDYNLISPATPMYLTSSRPTPVARSSRIVSGDQLEMTFEVVPNVSYVLKTKSDLSDTNWVTHSSFTAQSTSTNLTISMTNSSGRGFFRLETAP